MILHDKDIREPLFDYLEESYGKIRIIEEKTMGQSRADVIMVTPDALYGIEIKSDADTYTRLSSQVKDYDKYFDYNIAVVGSSHALHIREHIPSHWGVITVEMVDESLDFYVLSKPSPNPKASWKRKLELLWRPELAKLQETYSMPKYKEKKKSFVAGKIVEWLEKGKIEEIRLRGEVSNLLFERDYNTIEEELEEYRKGEIAKKLVHETDILTQVELYSKQSLSRQNLKKHPRRRKR